MTNEKEEIESRQLFPVRTMHLFAGAGGGILADILLGHVPICAVEIDKFCRKVILQRQQDGILSKFPVFRDVRYFDGKPWRGFVEVLAGGFPCQDVSTAGKGGGIKSGRRSGLWKQFARIIAEVESPFVFVENVPMLVTRGLDIVLRDLADMGYDARWCVLGVRHVGGPHKRDRIWIFAYSRSAKSMSDAAGVGHTESKEWISFPAESEIRSRTLVRNSISSKRITGGKSVKSSSDEMGKAWGIWSRDVESKLDRVADGLADQLDRIKALGNGQVPIVAATAWRMLGGPVTQSPTREDK